MSENLFDHAQKLAEAQAVALGVTGVKRRFSDDELPRIEKLEFLVTAEADGKTYVFPVFAENSCDATVMGAEMVYNCIGRNPAVSFSIKVKKLESEN